ncbi:hypothetical protein KVT40_006033 [Elsinoe batatas]|uniref:Myb-like domain-containing protein n=1 Tax=Elsinoe batatas TaxID=2601811 RepID=A0A8K0KY18_9PEZI|nr:hypothetical protein KVT40_006033 [Elsinoe batatas]
MYKPPRTARMEALVTFPSFSPQGDYLLPHSTPSTACSSTMPVMQSRPWPAPLSFVQPPTFGTTMSSLLESQSHIEPPGLTSSADSSTCSNYSARSPEAESASPRTASSYPSPAFQPQIPWSVAATNAFHPVQVFPGNPSFFQPTFFSHKTWEPTPAWPGRVGLSDEVDFGRDASRFHNYSHHSSYLAPSATYPEPEFIQERPGPVDTSSQSASTDPALISPTLLRLQPIRASASPPSLSGTLHNINVRVPAEAPNDAAQKETDQPPRQRVDNSKLTASERKRRDNLLLKLRGEGKSYREIQAIAGFEEHESTLRGRMRILQRPEHARKRKPVWCTKDIRILEDLVDEEIEKAIREKKFKIRRGKETKSKYFKAPWCLISERLHERGAAYPFGPASCSKKWKELHPDGTTV